MALTMSLLAVCVAGIGASSTRASEVVPTICPQKPPSSESVSPTEICYYLPEIELSPRSGTVAVNQTFSFTLEVRYAEYGCSKTGSWGGTITTDASGHFGPQSFTVGPFGSTGTYTFGVSCGGRGGTNWDNVVVTVVSGGGGDPGSGGGPSCTENLTSQTHATFVAMSGVPASIPAGGAFTANVTFQNTGSCTWTAANGYRLGSQNPENNTTWGTSRIYLGASEAIAPGQSKTFVINAYAPATAGSYGWGWRMVREGINWMGTPTNGSFTTISVTGSVPPQPSGSAPVGVVDEVDLNGIVSGWTCDADSYGTGLTVSFFVDGAFVASATANLTRSDASGSCAGTTAHGFSYSLPLSYFNGVQHSVTVYGANVGLGSNAALSGSPKSFLLSTSGVTAWADGWTEDTYDSSGNLISHRSGTWATQPYADLSDTRMLQGLGSGCRTVKPFEEGHSSIFKTLVYKFYQAKHWCWNYPNIVTTPCSANPIKCLFFTDDISDVAKTENYQGVQTRIGYYYTWAGSNKGGHYSKLVGKFDNCILKYGCIGSSYPWVEIFVNGNGRWRFNKGGGA